jgi:hypothetical protein
MKLRFVLALFLLAFAAIASASDSQSSFEKLKALQGNWSGKAMNRDIQVSFRVTSGGSAVMSEIQGDEDMITMFNLDGDRLMMTHYCGAGNQPRMVGTMSPDGKSIRFDFLDATNVLPSQPGHMQRLTITMLDNDHHTETWEFMNNDGKIAQHETFDLKRMK